MRTFFALYAIAALVVAVPALADPPAAEPTQARIVVPSRDIVRGEIIADSDLTYQAIAGAQMKADLVTSMNELDGMQTRRFLHMGEPVRSDDVRPPVLVTKGSTVTMNFDAPGITLTAIGKAMTEGGLGETITVLNPISYRQITGVVTGAGTVRAGDVTPFAPPNQIAQAQP
jgi:flagella basal body P-ring formation protein FlgA